MRKTYSYSNILPSEGISYTNYGAKALSMEGNDDTSYGRAFGLNTVDELAQTFLDNIRPVLEREEDMKEQERLRAIYPALQTAWEHYQIILMMCRSDAKGRPEADTEQN